MSGPFKMKGSPFQRNFGIGASPMKQDQLFDVTGDGVSASDIETSWEKTYRGHSPRGSVSDLLKRRKKRGWSTREEYVDKHEKEFQEQLKKKPKTKKTKETEE